MEGDTTTQACLVIRRRLGSRLPLGFNFTRPWPNSRISLELILPHSTGSAMLFWKHNWTVCCQLSTWPFPEVLGNEAYLSLLHSLLFVHWIILHIQQRTWMACRSCVLSRPSTSLLSEQLSQTSFQKRVFSLLISYLQNLFFKLFSLPWYQTQKHWVGFSNGLGGKKPPNNGKDMNCK